MAALSSTDIKLLEAQLPDTVSLEVNSDRYPLGRGYVELRASGPLGAPLIVCLHGIGSNSEGYRPQLSGLSERFRVLAWNAPGYGASTPLAMASPNADDYADVILGLLNRVSCSRMAALVGSSWGSVIAMAFAVRSPERLGRLILSAPNTGRGRLSGVAREEALAQLLESGKTPDEAARMAVVARLLPPDAPLLVRKRVSVLREAVTPGGWAQAARMLFSAYTPSLVGNIQCPIDVLVGERDTLAPIDQHARLLCKAAPSIRLHVFEGCAHMLKLEAPGRFNSIVAGEGVVAN